MSLWVDSVSETGMAGLGPSSAEDLKGSLGMRTQQCTRAVTTKRDTCSIQLQYFYRLYSSRLYSLHNNESFSR
jgi:hypothetical protein